MSHLGTTSPFFPLPDGIVIASVHPMATSLVVQIACCHLTAACPLCQQPSERVHGDYVRTVADLPCAGRRVILALTVRKFVCATPTCPRKIFTERLSELVQSYARMSNRLREALVALGLATSAEVSERLAPSLGMRVSASTLLRRLRTVACPPPASVHILGVDDWAWKKGQTYGTLLVDLELRKPIELLPDRQEATLTAWLRTHPEVEVVSRDRGGEYAAAARKGAPQAQQIADKFHILKNLRDGLKDLMARKQKWLPEVEEERADAIPKKARGKLQEGAAPDASQEMEHEHHFRHMSPTLRKSGSPPTIDAETYSQASRANRYSRYEAVRALHQQGVSLHAIARRFGMARKTVRQFVRVESFPERSRPASRGSLLDPYKPYILKRWQQGCCNGAQLSEEIKAHGYTGSASLLRRFIADLRKQHQATSDTAAFALDGSQTPGTVPTELPPAPLLSRRMSPTRASWLCVSQPVKLDEKQRRQVDQIRKGHADLETAYQLSQAFVSMVAERRDKDLDAWLLQAKHSGIAELKSFAQGIGHDYAAVRAAFSSVWSNGQVEGQVNRLKVHKRQMYGRAQFDLLRLRVLHAG